MNLNLVKPRKALNKAFLKVKPNRSEIENFKANLIQLLDTINESESEEFHKNLVSQFLKDTYYKDNHYINTKGRNDLVVHNGKDAKSTVGVIIEAKKPTNKTEMLRKDKINTKALQELVLYYLRERITQKNLEIKYVVATNIYEWFIFDASIFEREFAQNKGLVKQFQDFEEERLSGTKTDFFYKEIAEPAIENIKGEIEFTWFDIRKYEKPLRNNDKKDDNKLIALYKLLSPEHLLKLPFTNDSNTLDKSFYNELLHIIGLKETKEGSKKLIGRKPEGERDPGSFIENTITILKYEDCLSQIKASNYGDTKEEQLYNVALELVITWINRILFLKLLEGQLVKYHRGDSSFKFLNFERIPNYDKLNKLFFQVLAIKEQERNELVKKEFEKVPYLNSSLFEPNELEHKTVRISNLEDEYTLPLLNTTVLRDKTGKRQKGEKVTIEYLFRFLDAYDFAGEGAEDIQEDNKTLINASVLGLIFEKINGYKDGSFFTPGFITMYMARETIRRAVVQKFNEEKRWNCKDFNELYDKIDNKKEANEIINGLKICDPAVGSGHFLVSALNEIIAIKSELKVLLDREGKTLRDYRVEVQNDELIITDEDGRFLEYNPNSHESQRIQETLFHEKQTIIENCLFGVDINPNSVKICRLRLWIELLKNAYYRQGTEELETLPNIDINIKAGNSLISRYPLDADIKKALKKSKWTIDSYRLAVMTYRNAKSREEKRAMQKLIDQIKNDFESEIAANDKRVIRLNKLKGELYALTTQTQLFDQTKKEKAEWNKKVNKLTETINKLETELEEIKNNKIYENAFEWRFEFPEVLNDDGDYIGFDIVIGNPPYGVSFEKEGFLTSESYLLFYCLGIEIIKFHGFLTFITPESWTINNNSAFLRQRFVDNGMIYIIRDVYKVFQDAPDVWCNIPFFMKTVKKGITEIRRDFPYDQDFFQFKTNWERFKKLGNKRWFVNINDSFKEIFNKIDKLKPIKEFCNINRGFSPTPNAKNLTKVPTDRQVIGGEDFGRYIKKIKNKYLVDSYKKSAESINEVLSKPFIAIQRIRTNSLDFESRWLICNLFEKGYVPIDSISYLTCESEDDLKYILGILNSKLLNKYYKFHYTDKNVKPIYLLEIGFKIDREIKKKIQSLVDEIITLKDYDNGADTTELEKEIDQLVYQLYGLTEEEIEIVENS
ncbi:MAG: Eco57I restriction-modification methylase domain-containing protein [Thiohalospira sp.]